MKKVVIRQGDTWSYTAQVQFTGADGNQVSAAGWTVTSSLIDGNRKLLQFDTGWVNEDAGLLYHRATSAATSKLPVGSFTFNLKFVSPQQEVVTSETVSLVVDKKIS